MQVRVATDERGRRVLEKTAETEEEAARLRREVDLLDVAGHPGLVELVSFDEGPSPRLTTTHLDGPPLIGGRAFDVEEVAGVIAAVASTLADLHAMGLVHGAVCGDHVLLDADGRPVLCGLGYGGLAGERARETPPGALPSVDPGRDGDNRLDPALDVFAVGVLLRTLLAAADGRGRRSAADALGDLAQRATASAPAERPSARELADAVADAVPAARLPSRLAEAVVPSGSDPLSVRRQQRPLERLRGGQGTYGPGPSARPLWRPAMGLAALAALAAAVVVLALVRPAARAPEEPVAAPGFAADPESGDDRRQAPEDAPPRVASLPVEPPRGCAAVAGVLSVDVDGDGCAEAVVYRDGVLEAGPRRWAVGQPGDLVSVGDWSCSGTPTLAVLRSGTGEVFAFPRWATAGEEVSAPLIARVGGGHTLRAADLDGDACHELVVERVSGPPAVLRAERARP